MSDAKPTNLLNVLEVASPCTASWDEMQGGDTVRFCSQCQLNVYNLSAMPAAAAETLLRERAGEGRLCAGFYRRHDGTVITRDCPVGLAAVRAKLKRAIVGSLTLAASLVAAMFSGCTRSADTGSKDPLATMNNWVGPDEPVVLEPISRSTTVAPSNFVTLGEAVCPPQEDTSKTVESLLLDHEPTVPTPPVPATPEVALELLPTCPPKLPDKAQLIMGKFLPPKPLRDLNELRDRMKERQE